MIYASDSFHSPRPGAHSLRFASRSGGCEHTARVLRGSALLAFAALRIVGGTARIPAHRPVELDSYRATSQRSRERVAKQDASPPLWQAHPLRRDRRACLEAFPGAAR